MKDLTICWISPERELVEMSAFLVRDQHGGMWRFVIGGREDRHLLVYADYDRWRHMGIVPFVQGRGFVPLGGGNFYISFGELHKIEWNSSMMEDELGFDRPKDPDEADRLLEALHNALSK